MKTRAWGVHLYTAIGLVLAAIMAVLLADPTPEAYRWIFRLMMLATLVDATDGWFARRYRVQELLPGFDGRRLDDITDFLTYTFIPLLVIWRADLLPESQTPWLLVPLLASAYGFCQVQVKTEDGYFLGFPSYWNVVAFYLYFLRLAEPWALVVLLLLAVLTFVPLRYLYPSLPGRLNRWTTVLGAAWTLLLLRILWPASDGASWLIYASLYFPAYYLLASWWNEAIHALKDNARCPP